MEILPSRATQRAMEMLRDPGRYFAEARKRAEEELTAHRCQRDASGSAATQCSPGCRNQSDRMISAVFHYEALNLLHQPYVLREKTGPQLHSIVSEDHSQG